MTRSTVQPWRIWTREEPQETRSRRSQYEERCGTCCCHNFLTKVDYSSFHPKQAATQDAQGEAQSDPTLDNGKRTLLLHS
jgi:hypothetical protein